MAESTKVRTVWRAWFSEGLSYSESLSAGITTAPLYSVHRAGLLDVQNMLSADTGIPWRTEGHSFGDKLICESVSVTPSSVTEASTVLCSVSL
jgi:hypothetical protein